MKRFIAVGAVLLLAARVQAQETRDTFTINPLVVSVARVPIARAAASAAVSVITADELQQRGMRTVEDALRMVPGATLVQSGSYGSFGSLFLRGGESDYVQVLVDGIRVNSPGEHFDFSNFTLEDVDRIEVVRGPASVLYGSDAMSGIVEIFTRHGSERTHLNVAASGGIGSRVGPTARGSFGSGSFETELRGGTPRLNYSAGVSQFVSDGAYAFNNRNRNTGSTARLGYLLDPATSIALTARYSRNLFHYPTDGSGALVDDNQRDLTNSVAAGLELVHRFSTRFDVQALATFDRNDDDYDDAPDSPADTLGFYASSSQERFQREGIDARGNYALGVQTILTGGAEYEKQHERGWYKSESQYGPYDTNSRSARNNRAVYGQLLGHVSRVNYQIGLRRDDNDQFGAFTTYRAGVSAPVTGHLRVRASAGTAFKQPRFYEQFATGYVKGNPNLEPEKSASIDGGVEYQAAAWRVAGTWFGQRFRDLIQYVGAPAHANDPNYVNLGAARAAGLELEAERASALLSVRASYTYLKTRVTDAGTGEDPLFTQGSRLVRRPTHSAALSFSHNAAAWSAAATATYVGRRDDLDFRTYPSPRLTLKSYARLDLNGQHELGQRNVRATLRLENALNASYQEAFNFPARRRLVYVGITYSF